MSARNIASAIERLLPAELVTVARVAAESAARNRTRAVFVGGVVRDVLLDRPVVDADIMIEPPSPPVAHDIARKTGGRLTEHSRFQTYALALPTGRKVDLVTAREETYPSPATLPKVVPASIDRDQRRRDFTINAMVCLLDREFGDIVDPFGGQADLDAKVIRALHEKSFVDDPTRIFRAARFAGRLGFRVESATRSWIDASVRAGFPGRLSPARRRNEFELILTEYRPTAALQLLKDWGCLGLLHPDWDGVDVPSLGLDDVRAPDESISLMAARLARWLRWWGPRRAQDMMSTLNFERDVKRAVAKLIV